MKQIRSRLTYANVMSSIAVFLILGGATAFAAKKIGSNEIKGNSITTGKIKKEAVTSAKIKKESITTGKIKNNAVTGAKVADGSLTSVDLSATTLAPACPSGTVLSQGVCIETPARTSNTFLNAIDTCISSGRRLPTINELIGFARKVQPLPATEWSGDLFSAAAAFVVESNGTPNVKTFTEPQPFRCVGAPTP
ncbi:MAG TPA: hypothetical protein VHR65_02470 [Solirubrobacterales bacterium]|nr:hypothetical protein [Solirubrobacterales bacterium]